ncbi:hypothetical protein BROC_00355 [Candidatus Brocadiaceae bacterium]|nr:hypothetical protein BROC_00355 [Candidatus Brocadiaceae bacterium]
MFNIREEIDFAKLGVNGVIPASDGWRPGTLGKIEDPIAGVLNNRNQPQLLENLQSKSDFQS